MRRSIKRGANLKPGLYFRVAKYKGYTVIQFDPTTRTQIFSTNCNLHCKIQQIDIQTQTCRMCGAQFCLFIDPIMFIFQRKVRIDLINNKYCYLARCQHEWEPLPFSKEEQLSDIQYIKAVRSLSKDRKQLKQCLNNYYNYKIMPTPIQKSYWQDYKKSDQNLLCVIESKNNSEFELNKNYLQVMVDDKSYKIHGIKGQIICSSIKHGFLVILCRYWKQCKLQIYELSEHVDQYQLPLSPIHTLDIQVKMKQSISAMVVFQNQCVHILIYQNTKHEGQLQLKLVKIINIMSSCLEIEVQYKFLSHNCIQECKIVYPLVEFMKEQGQQLQNKQTIIHKLSVSPQELVYHHHNCQIRIPNQYKLQIFQGIIADYNKNALYLYQFSTHSLKLIIINHSPPQIQSKQIQFDNFVVTQLPFQQQLQYGNKIIYSRPVIDGCILYYYLQKGTKLCTAKTCIL